LEVGIQSIADRVKTQEVRGQMTEIRGQMAEDRGQMSEVGI
jgi:hypothetical protein